MRRAEVLTALGFIAFAIAVIQQARQVGVGWAEGQPQAGFFPYWLGLLLGVSGLVVLGRVIISANDPFVAFFHDRTAVASVVKVSGTGAAMLVLTYLVGFYAGATVYLFFYTRVIGKYRWPAVIVMSFLIPMGSYLLFERTLQILLPRGLYDILPFLD